MSMLSICLRIDNLPVFLHARRIALVAALISLCLIVDVTDRQKRNRCIRYKNCEGKMKLRCLLSTD